MIFQPKHIEDIYAQPPRKTQTRRVQKAGEWAEYGPDGEIIAVYTAKGRRKYYLGQELPVQPGRTAKGDPRGKIRIFRIRDQRVQDISEEDAIAEGMPGSQFFYGIEFFGGARERFASLWDRIHKWKPDVSWPDNPKVWPLTFGLAEAARPQE